jgi:hypothetical protein
VKITAIGMALGDIRSKALGLGIVLNQEAVRKFAVH